MTESDDITLLKQYADGQSEAAFSQLVERYVNLVHSTALRQVQNPSHAEEIAQAVFIILAQKAKSIGPRTILSGWLYQAARLTAANFLRSEIRRQLREQEAYMESLFNQPTPDIWPQVAPLLDDAMGKLGEKDRNVVVLRFFQNKSAAEIGDALGIDSSTAQKRITRAVERLRKYFTKRRVTHPAGLITASISANSVQAAPLALAKTISAVAMAKGAAAGTTTLTLVKGALKIMAWTKAKTAIVAGVAVLLAASSATVIVKQSFFPAIKDAYFQPNYRLFQNLPNGLFVVRPTHFSAPVDGLDYSGEGTSGSGEHVTRMMGRNRSFEQLVARIYGCEQSQIVFPANIPKDHFDYLFTIMDNHAQQRFEASLKKKLGYVANWQEHDTDVFLLEAQTPNLSRLKPGDPAHNSPIRQNSRNRLEFRNRSLGDLAREIETSANIPVFDKTGVTDSFNFDLDCTEADLADRNWDNVNQALQQLGLELVPTNIPMKMLVVEKVK